MSQSKEEEERKQSRPEVEREVPIALVSISVLVLEGMLRTRLAEDPKIAETLDPEISSFRVLLDRYKALGKQQNIKPLALDELTIRAVGLSMHHLDIFANAWDIGDIVEGTSSYSGAQIGNVETSTRRLVPFVDDDAFIPAIVTKLVWQQETTRVFVNEPTVLRQILHAEMFRQSPITVGEMCNLAAAIEADGPVYLGMQLPATPDITTVSNRGRGLLRKSVYFFALDDIFAGRSAAEIQTDNPAVREEEKERKLRMIQRAIFARTRGVNYPDGRFSETAV